MVSATFYSERYGVRDAKRFAGGHEIEISWTHQ